MSNARLRNVTCHISVWMAGSACHFNSSIYFDYPLVFPFRILSLCASMTSRRAYYYDRETEEILKCVRYVDGDASQDWERVLTLLLRHLQPAVEVYLKTSLGTMFESVVKPPPWTESFFPEVLERHHRAFEECGVERWAIHARNFKELIRARRDAVSWLDALRLIAVRPIRHDLSNYYHPLYGPLPLFSKLSSRQ